MKNKISIVGLFAIVSIAVLAVFANAVATCDATGLYDCTGWGGDSDNDGLCDVWEDSFYGTDKWAPDTDSGGTCDGDEILLDGTDPFDGDDDIA